MALLLLVRRFGFDFCFDPPGRFPLHQIGQPAVPRYLWPLVQVFQPPRFALGVVLSDRGVKLRNFSKHQGLKLRTQVPIETFSWSLGKEFDLRLSRLGGAGTNHVTIPKVFAYVDATCSKRLQPRNVQILKSGLLTIKARIPCVNTK